MMLNNYINYIISKGINLHKNQIVEIVCSSYLKKFINELKNACLKFGASSVYIKYVDGMELQQKIMDGYKLYINEDIENYTRLIANGFCRIVVQSPFLIPMILSNDKIYEYQQCLKKLEFVQTYFNNLKSSKTVCLASNPYWASKLRMKEEELWERIIRLSIKDVYLENIKDYINSLSLRSLSFNNSLGTNLQVYLTKNCVFQGRKQKTISGIEFQPNIPSLEIYTAPNKYSIYGTVVSTKPLYYRGDVIEKWKLVFKDGKVIQSNGLDKIINLHPKLSYVGEIALCETIDEINYFSTLLNENTCCHLALGNAYEYGIIEKDKINHCPYHIDLSFGSGDLKVIGKSLTQEYVLLENGKFRYEEKNRKIFNK